MTKETKTLLIEIYGEVLYPVNALLLESSDECVGREDLKVLVIEKTDTTYYILETNGLNIEARTEDGPLLLGTDGNYWKTSVDVGKLIFVPKGTRALTVKKGTLLEELLLEKYPQLKD